MKENILNKAENDGSTKYSKQEDLKKEEETKKSPWWVKMIIFFVIATVVVLLIVFRDPVMKALKSFLKWVEENPVLGPVLLSLVYIVCVVFFFPGSILTLGSGFALK